MWFRIFIAGWSVAFLGLLGWLATHQSSESTILGRYSSGYLAMLLGIAGLAAISLLAQRPFLYRRLYAARGEILLTFFSVLGALLLAEVATRLIDPVGISYFAEIERFDLNKLPDPVLYYRLAPGLRETYQGVPFHTNKFGMRDRELARKQDGELRIMLLGDSVTMGWGVPAEATFGRKLEGMLSAKLGRAVRTVNTAVNSYNTVSEYAVLRTYSDVVEPDLVILLYVNNDHALNKSSFDPRAQLSLPDRSPPQLMRMLLGKSWLYRLGSFALKYSEPRAPERFNSESRGVAESMAALAAIAEHCRDHGIQFVTFFYRSKGEPAVELSNALFAKVQAVGQSHGFPVYDIAPWWSHVERRSVTNSVVDAHPNAQGHEIIATGMANFLLTQVLVDPKSPAAR